MELFKKLSEILSENANATIVVQATKNGGLVVSTTFGGKALEGDNILVPFVLKGTAEELDAEFVNQLSEPIAETKGLISNIASYKASVEANKKAIADKAKSPASTASSASDKFKAEADKRAAKQKLVKTLTDEAEKAKKAENYFTALAIYEKLVEIDGDNAKAKKDYTSAIETLKGQTVSFFCKDNKDAADKCLADLLAKAQPSDAKPAEEPKVETEPAPAETVDTTAEEDADSDNDIDVEDSDGEDNEADSDAA